MVELLQQARVFILCRGRKPQGPAARGHDLDQLELAACQQVLAAWDDWLGVECVVGSVPLGQPQVLQLPFVTLRDLRLLHTTLVAARDTYRFPVNMPVVCAHRSDVAVAGMVPELLAMTCGSLSETLPVAAVLVVDAWEDIPRRLLRQGPSVLIGTLHRGKCQVLLHSTRKADDGLGIAVGGGGGGGGGAGGGVATGAGVAWNIVVPNSGSLLGASGTPRVPRVIGNPMFHHPILQAMSECHRQLGEYMDVTSSVLPFVLLAGLGMEMACHQHDVLTPEEDDDGMVDEQGHPDPVVSANGQGEGCKTTTGSDPEQTITPTDGAHQEQAGVAAANDAVDVVAEATENNHHAGIALRPGALQEKRRIQLPTNTLG